MNFNDLANFVCQKAQLVTTDDLAFCKLSISRRYELLWDSNLWRDSLIMAQIPFDPINNQDNAEGIVLLPELVNLVVGIRTLFQSVRVQSLEYYYRIDWDAFNQGTTNLYGAAAEFALLSPVWFIWRGQIGLQLNYADPVADTAPSQITWRDENNIQYVQTVNNGALLNSSNVSSSVNLIPAGAAYDGSGDYFYTGTIGDVYNFTLGANEIDFRVGGGTPSNPFTANSASFHFTGTPSASVTATLSLVPDAKLEIESLFKPSTIGTVSLNPQFGTVAGGTLSPSVTASPSYQRIRLFSVPTAAMTLNVLGKRPFVPLTFAQQVPQLRGIDNVLIAFAGADLLKRARQYGKAQAELTEGVALLKELASKQVLQQANYQCFIPADGAFDPFFSASNAGGGSFWGYAFP